MAVWILSPTHYSIYSMHTQRAGRQDRSSPCWSGEALCETRAETAGKVMEDSAAMVPAAHIILNNTHKSSPTSGAFHIFIVLLIERFHMRSFPRGHLVAFSAL